MRQTFVLMALLLACCTGKYVIDLHYESDDDQDRQEQQRLLNRAKAAVGSRTGPDRPASSTD